MSMPRLLLWLVLLCPLAGLAAPAVNDLRDWQPSAQGVRTLDGLWQLRWREPLRAERQVRLPFTWHNGERRLWGGVGFGQIELSTQLLLPPGDAELALRIDDIKSAARIWVDDELVAQRGVPGDARHEEARLEPLLVPLPNDRETVALRIEISNHFHREGGVDMPIQIGLYASLHHDQARHQALYQFTMGGAVLMALFMGLLSRGHTRELGGAEFSMMLVLAALRAASTSDVLDLLLGWPALWVYRVEYLSGLLYPAVYGMLLYRLFPLDLDRRWVRLLQGVSLTCAVLILITPAAFFTNMRNPCAAWIVFWSLYFLIITCIAVRRRRQGAQAILGGMLLLTLTVFNDLLLHTEGILTLNLIPLGVLAFLLSHGLVLGQRVLAALGHNIQLSERLQGLNASLELRVEQRTEGLRKSRDLLDSTLAQVQTAVLSLDAEGRISALNERFQTLFGLREQPASCAELVAQLLQSGMAMSVDECHALVPLPEARLREREDLHLGNGLIIEVHRRSLTEGGWVSTYADVTALRLAAQDPQGGTAGQWSLDLGSRRLQGSEGYWALLGYPHGNVPGELWLAHQRVRSWPSWVHPLDRPLLRDAWRAALRGAGELQVKLRVAHAGGQWMWVSLRGRCILDRRRRPQRWVGVLENIDRQERSQQALEEARDKALRDARHTAELLAELSHELRTPLVAIHGHLTLLFDDATSPQVRLRLGTVLAAASGLTELLDGLLALARAEAVQLPQRSRFDVGGLLGECVAILQPLARDKGLALEMYVDPRLPGTVDGMPSGLRQVIYNLIGNAIKFTERGGVRVRLEALPGDGGLLLSVIDSGPGIPNAQFGTVFEPFTRLDRHEGVPGIGLGLYIVQRLVELMGGVISLDSHEGVGTQVRVQLPWPLLREPLPQSLPDTALAGLYTLLVEDVDINRAVTCELLERWGCRVDAVADGGSAVEQCRRCEYDLVLMDMRLPDIDGLTAARLIREQTRGIGPLIVALSANARELDIRECRAAGLDGILAKPLQRGSLQALLSGQDGFASLAEEGSAGDISGLRLAQLRDWLGEGVFDRLLPTLLESLREVRAGLHGLDEQQPDLRARLESLRHRLRGSAMNFGLQALASAAERTDGPARVPMLLACLDEHLALLEDWLSEGEPVA